METTTTSPILSWRRAEVGPVRRSRRRVTAVVVFLTAVLVTTALPLAPASAQETGPTEFVGVMDDDFNVTSDQFVVTQEASIEDPGTATGSMRKITLWMRNLADSCQNGLVVRVTNPQGESTTQRPFRGCSRPRDLHSTTLEVSAAGAGTWTLAYRGADGQNYRIPAVRIDAFGPPVELEPAEPETPENPFEGSEPSSGVTLLGGEGTTNQTPNSETQDIQTPTTPGNPDTPTGPTTTPNDPPIDPTACPSGDVIDAVLALNTVMTGPYDPETRLMRDDLRAFDVLPTIDPYFGRKVVDETVFDVTGPDAIVDWVVVELRHNPSPGSVGDVPNTWAVQVPALIQRDGDIVDVDGVSPVRVPANLLGKYRPVVWHRSHAPTAFPTFTLVYNRVVQASPDYVRGASSGDPGGPAEPGTPETELSGGTATGDAAPLPMMAGDANGDFDISGDDKTVWFGQNGSSQRLLPDGSIAPGVYMNGDFNMDGSVDGGDKAVWEPLNGTFFFDAGTERCAPGTNDTGNPISYPDANFRPDHVSAYSYQVVVDQLFVAPNLAGDVSTNNPADNEVERNRVEITADIDFTAYVIEEDSQWVKLDITNAAMTPTSGRYEDSDFSQVDQTTPIAAADASPSEWSESDIWTDTDTPTETMASQLAGSTYFRRDLDGSVLEIIHPLGASGNSGNLNARNIKEGMINLLSMQLAGSTDEFSVLEQDRSGRRAVEYSAARFGGNTVIDRSTPGGTAPAATKGLVAGSADATITLNADGETTSIVSTEVIEIDESADTDTVDASDPFADVAPLKAKVWTQSTLNISQVPVPLANPAQAAVDARADRDGAHLRSVLSDHLAQQLYEAAEIDNNIGLEADVRAELEVLTDQPERWMTAPTFDLGDDVTKFLRLFPDRAEALAADAASGSWSRSSQEIVVGALGSVGNRGSQLGLVDYASTVNDASLRQMAVVSMVLLEDPIDEAIDYLTTIVVTPEDDPFEELVVDGGDVTIGSDVTNSAMLVLGSLGGRIDDPQKAEEIRAALVALQAASDPELQRVAGDSLENFAANRPGSESPLQAFVPEGKATEVAESAAGEFARRSSATAADAQSGAIAKSMLGDPAFPIGGPFWGHCGWVDTANGGDGGWVSGGVLNGPAVDNTGGQHVKLFGHPEFGEIPTELVGLPQYSGALLIAQPGDCIDFAGTGVAGHYYGHCVRTEDASQTNGILWVEPEYAPGQWDLGAGPNDTWLYAEFPGSVLPKNRTAADPWGNPPELMPWSIIFVALPPGECRLLNDGEVPTPGGGTPGSTPTSTGEPDNEGFHWEKQFGPDFVHADLYASLDLPRSGDRGAVFRAEAGANVTVAGRTATVFRAKAESALDLVDETSANNFGANQQIGQIERDLTLQGWFFNNKVIDREIGIPCGAGASGELFEIPALNLSFSKTIMVAGFIPVEFAGGLGANISSPWEWSADSCDIFFGSDALVTLAGSVGVEGRAEVHLTAGINLVFVKGGGGVGGTIVGFGADAGASLQLFRPSTNRGPELCFSFGAQLIPPSISAYVWYKLLWKKKKTKDLFSWNPTFPPPVNIGSSCPTVAAHRLQVQTGDYKDEDNGDGPSYTNPSWNGHRIAIPNDAAQALINDPGEASQFRMVTGDVSDTVFDTIAAFCAAQGYGPPVLDALDMGDAAPGEQDVKYAYVDGAWGYEDADLGFQQINAIRCANGDVALSTQIQDPASGAWVSANSPTGAVIAVPAGTTDVPLEFRISNVGTGTIHDLQMNVSSLGQFPVCNRTTLAPAGAPDDAATCTLNLDTTSVSGQVETHVVSVEAAATAGGEPTSYGSFNWYTCFGCAPSGGTPGGTNPTTPGSDPEPIPGLEITKVEIKAGDVGFRQNATSGVVPHVEVPASVSVFITVKNTHSAPLTDLEFQGIGLDGSGDCGGSVIAPQDSRTCRITLVSVNAGANDRTVKAFGVSADADSQPVYSNLQNWFMFGEDLRFSVTKVTLDGANAQTGRPPISQNETITFTIENTGGPGAVDLDSLQLTSPGLTNVSCPYQVRVGDSEECTATVEFDPDVTDSVEFTATISAEGEVSDRSATTDVTWGWSATAVAPTPWQNDLQITDIQLLASGTSTIVTSTPAHQPIDVRVTVQNTGAETVNELKFDLVGLGNGCEGYSLGQGASVDCIIYDVDVVPGPATTAVRAEGVAASADVFSDPFTYTVTGEAPSIQITDIRVGAETAIDPRSAATNIGPTMTNMAPVELTNLGLEEGIHQVSISILNTDATTTPGAVTVSSVSVSAMGLTNVACPASIAPGTTGVCTADFEVWPTDAGVSRSVEAKATYSGTHEVADLRSWSWSYQPRFTLELQFDETSAPAAASVDPGSHRVGVMLVNTGKPGNVTALSFNEEQLTLSDGQNSPALICDPPLALPEYLVGSQFIECDLFVDVASVNQTVVATATLDGVTKTAQLDLVVGDEVVDIGEPPTGQTPSNAWGTGTGGFVIGPVAGESMPTSITYGGRTISGAELDAFSHVWSDSPHDWEIEILPTMGNTPIEGSSGSLTVHYPVPELPEGVTRTFHVVLPGEFDQLLNDRLIDVTDHTVSYVRSPSGNQVTLSDSFDRDLRPGSVLVHSGGDNHPEESRRGFIQVVGSVTPGIVEELAEGRLVSAAATASTSDGDLLDVFRQKKEKNSQTGAVDKQSGAGGSVDVDFSVDFTSSFTPEFEIDVEWVRSNWYSVLPSPVLKYLRVGAQASAGVTYTATATATAAIGGDFPILPTTRLLAFPVGPVMVTVNISAEGVWNMEASATLTATGGVGASVSAWVEYRDTGSQPAASHSSFDYGIDGDISLCDELEGAELEEYPLGNSCFKPSYSGTFSAEAGLNIDVALLIADQLGPKITIGPRMSMAAGFTQNGVTSDVDFGAGIDLDMDDDGEDGEGLVNDLENARVISNGERDPRAGTADGVKSTSRSRAVAGAGMKFKGLAKRVFPEDINFNLGSFAGRWLEDFTGVFGKIVNTCAYARLATGGNATMRDWWDAFPGVTGVAWADATRTQWWGWRPPGNGAIRWHGHHIVPKSPTRNNTLVEDLDDLHTILEDAGYRVLTSCRNLVWAPNNRGGYTTPGHFAGGPDGWAQLLDDMGVNPSASHVSDVLETWSEKGCKSWVDYPGAPAVINALPGNAASLLNSEVCTL